MQSRQRDRVPRHGCIDRLPDRDWNWEGLPARISVLLEEGKAVGEFDITIPTVVMLSAFLSLLSPKSFERLMVEGQMSPDELVKHLGHLYFKGIAAV